MSEIEPPTDLSGKLLIAMPGMGGMRFERSVVFVCAHSEQGSMGLIVNKPAEDLTFASLMDQLSITGGPRVPDIRVHFGGPVEHGRGFVLHSGDYSIDKSTLEVDSGFGMTATRDILEDLAKGTGPDQALLALGYAGWGPGQLTGEIARNGWLVCDPNTDVVFCEEDDGKWAAALALLGVDPILLSGTSGRA